MRELHFVKAVKKDLRKLPRPLQQNMVNFYFPEILKAPSVGLALSGKLAGYLKYVIFYQSAAYRIVYQYNEKTILIVMVSKREGFYQRLLRRLF